MAVPRDAKKIDDIPISFASQSGDGPTSSLDRFDPSFMYTQLFKQILLILEYDKKAREEMVAHWKNRADITISELEFINNFVEKYDSTNAIRLYSIRECVYRDLNEALRLLKADIIVKMGFFIHDLHHEIKKLHEKQNIVSNGKPLTLYRGQALPKADLARLKARTGGLLAFNGFLSTSTDRDVSLAFADSNSTRPGMVGIHFRLTIDPKNASTPFANIIDYSKHPDEEEILFSMHAVFRIGEISAVKGMNNVYQVSLTLTADNDEDLLKLSESMKQKIIGDNAWARLAKLLIKIGHVNEAEKLYHTLLEVRPSSNDRAGYYHHLGAIQQERCDYEGAINYYKMAIAIEERNLHQELSWFAESYLKIGDAHACAGNILEVRRCQKMAKGHQDSILLLELPTPTSQDNEIEGSNPLACSQEEIEGRKSVLATALYSLAAMHDNTGASYLETKSYTEALRYHRKALEIRAGTRPENDSSLAISYNNIATVYYSMNRMEEAWNNLEKGMAIARKAFLDVDPDLAMCLKNTATMLSDRGHYSKAMICIKTVLTIQTRSLPPNHRALLGTYTLLGKVCFCLKNYPEALSYHQKTLDIWLNDKLADQELLATCCNNMGIVCYKVFLKCVKSGDSEQAKCYLHDARNHFEQTRVVSEKRFGSEAPETRKARDQTQWIEELFRRKYC